MSVFDNSVKIGVRVKDPGTDKNLTPSGSLDYHGMTSASALSGTTGIDCKLVHGDRWQEIKGNMTEDYSGSVKTDITQDEHISVGGTVFLNVTTGWNENQFGPVNRTYFKVVTDTFLMDHNVSVPSSAAFTVANYANTFTWVESVAVTLGTASVIVGGLALTLTAAFDLEFKSLHAEYHPFHGDGKAVKLYETENEMSLKAFIAKIESALHIRASANAGVDADAATPMT